MLNTVRGRAVGVNIFEESPSRSSTPSNRKTGWPLIALATAMGCRDTSACVADTPLSPLQLLTGPMSAASMPPASASTKPSVTGTPLDEEELELELEEELELDELELDEELELEDELEEELELEVVEFDELDVLLELDELETTITPDELLELEEVPDELELPVAPEEEEATVPEELEEEELEELVLDEVEPLAPELDELELDEPAAGGGVPLLLLSLLSHACSTSVRLSIATAKNRLQKNAVVGVPIGFPIVCLTVKNWR